MAIEGERERETITFSTCCFVSKEISSNADIHVTPIYIPKTKQINK